jgi:hypothetical protein
VPLANKPKQTIEGIEVIGVKQIREVMDYI